MKRKWMLVVLCAVSAACLSACTLLPEEETLRTAPLVRSYTRPEYHTVAVERGDLIENVKVSCNYVPVQTVSLSFAMDDEYIDRYFVQTGDTVQEGQLLAQLQLGNLESDIAATINDMEVLKLQMEYEARRFDIELRRLEITTAQMDALQKQETFDKARESYARRMQSFEDSLLYGQLSLEGLYSELDKRQIRAPFGGSITRVAKFEEGSKSEFGTGVITLVDSTRSIFRASTEYWDRFQPGDLHQITVKGNVYEAVVTREQELGLEPQQRVEGKRGYVYFALTQPSFELKEDDTGTVEIVLNERRDVLHVPAKAISEAGGKPIVYYLDENGLKMYKYVQTGLTIHARTEILSGLEAGESVIIK